MNQARLEVLFAYATGKQHLVRNYFLILYNTKQLRVSNYVKDTADLVDLTVYSQYYEYASMKSMQNNHKLPIQKDKLKTEYVDKK